MTWLVVLADPTFQDFLINNDFKLPKLEEFVHKIDFTEKERDMYNALWAFTTQAQGILRTYEDICR